MQEFNNTSTAARAPTASQQDRQQQQDGAASRVGEAFIRADWLRYMAGDKTVALWHKDEPWRRKVFSAQQADGSISPLFMVARYLAERKAVGLLSIFVDDDTDERLLRECADYCREHQVRDWQAVGDAVYGILGRYMRTEASRQLTKRGQVAHGLSDARFAAAGRAGVALEEE